MAEVFTYEHATVKACQKAGCTRSHLVLKDLAESIGRGWIGDRKGLNLRDPMRAAVVIGRVIKGTCNVPDEIEIERNQAHGRRKDTRRNKIVGSESTRLSSLSTARKEWYWHAGDPDVLAIKRLLISEVPADPNLGQECAICLASRVHDTRDADAIYCREDICIHAFHRTCIEEWFRQCVSSGQDTTCPMCVRPHPLPHESLARQERDRQVTSMAGLAAGGAACATCATFTTCTTADVVNTAPAAPSCGAGGSGSASGTAASSGAVVSSCGRPTRKRPFDEFGELEDTNKSSLKNRREAAASRSQQWEEGDTVEARWAAKRGGSGWFRGRVTRVHELTHADPGGPGRAYDISYEDGDEECQVMPRYVRAPAIR